MCCSWCLFAVFFNLDMVAINKSNKFLISVVWFQNCHIENYVLIFITCADSSPIYSAIMTSVKTTDNPDI